MKALIKNKNGVNLVTNLKDEPTKENFVKIQVKQVGLCRTDLLVAQGIIPAQDDIILGHEFSGIVLEDPSHSFSVGDIVSVNPFFGIGNFMGLNFDGCLRETIQVPLEFVIKSSDFIGFQKLAYLEPICASLAVLKACKNKNEIGAVFGKNRISELTYLILKNEGYNIQLLDENQHYEENSFDYIIETLFDEQNLNKIFKLLKQEGTLVVKSRKHAPAAISSAILVQKELTFRCVNYYDFNMGMQWLISNHHLIENLLGESYFIDEWEKAFEAAQNSENKKIFIHF